MAARISPMVRARALPTANLAIFSIPQHFSPPFLKQFLSNFFKVLKAINALNLLRVLRALRALRALNAFKVLKNLPFAIIFCPKIFPFHQKYPIFDHMNELLPSRGNYRQLLSYQKTDVILQITYFFCNHFLTRGDRTIDQMIQAARSGKQNIIEGSAASSTSAKTEIKLINVAKVSLRELLEDYEDFLKTRNYHQWEKDSIEYETMRRLGSTHNDAAFFMELISTRPPETVANMAIILINQADFLLFRQLKRLAADFLENGGFSERMTRLRRNTRGF